jgi:glyoxylase-like metal-dependent hydrolase (beta-lactamase superfamily II)
MPAFICTACGTQYAPGETPPRHCAVCEEERQYVPPGGQTWTTLEALAARHLNGWREYEPGVLGVGPQPAFAIGQRALVLRTPHGNVLWDCVSLIDAATVSLIEALGGLAAIAISHPHFYTTMVEWSRAFGAPIHLHAADRDWVSRHDPAIRFWDGETLALSPEVTLIRCGGHFPGGTALHWAKDGRGIVCSGDILSVTSDRKFVSFMRSYPNFIPLSAREVEGIAAALAPFSYDTIYGHYFDRVIPAGAQEVMRVSVARYLRAIAGEPR